MVESLYMEAGIKSIPSGGITSPQGFLAGAVSAGIKHGAEDSHDLGILFSEVPCAAAAVFTTNKIKAAPVILSRQHLQNGRAMAVVVNSGCANAGTGAAGMTDAVAMAEITAGKLGISTEDVIVASTGVIGDRLPMDRIRDGLERVAPGIDGGHDLARAIMTTDTVPKEVAVGADGFIIGGIAKGSGMIHPDLATMLAFLTTDADVEAAFLQQALRQAVDVSFNMVSIDGDTSTNDMVLLLANGMAGSEKITSGNGEIFQQALNSVCLSLAKAIARDGEGATRLIEVTVKNAASVTDARSAARTVVNSPLVKTAVHGSDPNWGRILAAAGRSGASVEEEKIDIYIGDICMVNNGCPVSFNREAAVNLLSGLEVSILIDFKLGSAGAIAWGCDLSEEYVTINSQYTT